MASRSVVDVGLLLQLWKAEPYVPNGAIAIRLGISLSTLNDWRKRLGLGPRHSRANRYAATTTTKPRRLALPRDAAPPPSGLYVCERCGGRSRHPLHLNCITANPRTRGLAWERGVA